MANRGVSGVSLNDFFSAVLKGIGAPVTANNLAKLGAIARIEGHGGDYNPFNYVVPINGSTAFNSVGVQNYRSVDDGVAQTIRMLQGSRPSQKLMLANLMSDDHTWNNWINSVSNFYKSWGGSFPNVSQANAASKLNEQIDGPQVSTWKGWSGEGGPPVVGSSPSPTSSQSSLGPITYHNWVTQGWNTTNQYTGLSTYLQGMMSWLTQNYGGQNLGGYGRRGIKSNPDLPSAHASGAAIDWGYGNNRATAEQVMNMIASDPNRYGIQEIHDYSGMRDWRVGRGWIPQPKGSHGGDMGPGHNWLHFEVSPERYNAQWGGGNAAGGAVGGGMGSMAAAMRTMLMGAALNPPPFGTPTPTMTGVAAARSSMTQPSVAPPTTERQVSASPSFNLGYYAGGPSTIPSAAAALAKEAAAKKKTTVGF